MNEARLLLKSRFFIIEAEVQEKADDDMKFGCFSALLFCTALLLSGCGAREPQEPVETTPSQTAAFTRESKIKDVKNAPMFGSYGRLLFPVEDSIAASAAVRAQRVRRRPLWPLPHSTFLPVLHN